MQTKRADFYLLSTSDEETRLLFICKLIEKVYLRQHKLFVYCKTLTLAHQLDESLWTFKPESFIPHHLENEGPIPPAPVQLGIHPPSSYYKDILINDTNQVPNFYTQFQRIIEIVDESEESKSLGREKYRFYQSYACPIFTHSIENQRPKETSCATT